MQNEYAVRALLCSKSQFMVKLLYRITIVAFLLLAAVSADGLAQPFRDAEFGIIPDSLHQIDSSSYEAPYIITNKERDVSFRDESNAIVAILDYHVRIKVFDNKVPEASIITIPYYFDDNMEQISGIKGWTHLPSGQRIALQQEDIRTVNINSRYNVKEFRMPGVKDGAILEYRYTIKRRYIEELPDFFLSDRVPTLSAKMTITYPRYMRYQPFIENYEGTLKHDVVYTDTSSVPKIFTIPQPKPIVTERWAAHDIPATVEEPYISSLNNYRAKMKFLMDEFGIPRQQLVNSWEVVVARMRQKTNPWSEVKKNVLAQTVGDSIATALSEASPKTVQDSIYRYLNRRMNFSGGHAAYSTTRDTTVLQGKAVDQAAINQTLLAMLEGAGIEAYPVMISSRESGTINKEVPSFHQFNAQIVRSEIGDETYLMDASFPFSEVGLIPVDMNNGPGLALKEKDFEWITLQAEKSNFDIRVNIKAKLETDGTLAGSVTAHQRGYTVQRIRRQKNNGMSSNEILKRTLFDGYGDVETDSVKIHNLSNFNKPVVITANFRIENYATSFSNGLEYRPMIVGYQRENPFEENERHLPITLDAPEKLDVSYTISLPEGFHIEEKKGNQAMSFQGGSFKERYDLRQGELNYEYHITIEKYQFSTEMFPRLYQLYERWATLSNARWLIKR